MASLNSDDTTSLSQATITIITVAVAIVILVGIGLTYRLVVSPPTPTPEESTASAPTEDWPSPPPTFTPTFSPTPRATLPPTPTFTPTPVPTIPPWSELSYLTSIEYHRVRTVVEVKRQRSGVGSVLGSDRVLLMAVGNIQIGVDLSQVEGGDVQIEGTTLKVTLPHAEIISIELLPEESMIYDSQQAVLFSQYDGLEIEAMDKAREQLKKETLSNKGMLELGELHARLQLTAFLHQIGFEEVEIIFK